MKEYVVPLAFEVSRGTFEQVKGQLLRQLESEMLSLRDLAAARPSSVSDFPSTPWSKDIRQKYKLEIVEPITVQIAPEPNTGLEPKGKPLPHLFLDSRNYGRVLRLVQSRNNRDVLDVKFKMSMSLPSPIIEPASTAPAATESNTGANLMDLTAAQVAVHVRSMHAQSTTKNGGKVGQRKQPGKRGGSQVAGKKRARSTTADDGFVSNEDGSNDEEDGAPGKKVAKRGGSKPAGKK